MADNMTFLRRVFRAPRIPLGRYTYRGRGKFAGLALQLRIEPSGQGLLVINANTVLYLNETAAAHAYFFMQGLPTDAVAKKIGNMYLVEEETAKRDHGNLLY